MQNFDTTIMSPHSSLYLKEARFNWFN